MVGCCQDEGVRHAGNNLFPFKAHMFRKERAAAVHGKARLKSRSSIKREAEARSGSCTLPAASPGARLVPARAALPVPGWEAVPKPWDVLKA